MREIKFRAWDKDNKCWLTNELFEVGELFINWQTDNSGKFYIHDKTQTGHNSIILEQFTGLLDKHGKEIYEGDIIRDASSGGYTKWWDGIVTWHNAGSVGWVAEPLPENKHRGAWGLNYNYEYEVIGNIHQNLEIIKERRNQ